MRGRQQRDAVRGDAEQSRVAERRQARVAEQDVEAHREDREDERLRQQSDPVRIEKWRRRHEENEERDFASRGHTTRLA